MKAEYNLSMYIQSELLQHLRSNVKVLKTQYDKLFQSFHRHRIIEQNMPPMIDI